MKCLQEFGSDDHLNPWLLKYLDDINMDVLQDGKLAKVFSEPYKRNGKPKNKLIPLIYCHGLTCTRTSQSGSCRDFASHGYIVFSLDFFDGTCSYTQKRNGESKFWLKDQHPLDRDLRDKQLDYRIQEVMGFIDDLSEPNFLQNTLGFDEGIELDLNRLIVGGHSFGGVTAIAVSQQDTRVKACFSLDPWLWCIHEKIQDGSFVLQQPQFSIVTEQFNPIIVEYFSYDTIEEVNRLINNSPHQSKSKSELVVLNKTNHYHQCDALVIVPVESFMKSQN